MGNTVVSALLRSNCQSSEETDDMWAFHHAIPLMISDGPIDFSIIGLIALSSQCIGMMLVSTQSGWKQASLWHTGCVLMCRLWSCLCGGGVWGAGACHRFSSQFKGRPGLWTGHKTVSSVSSYFSATHKLIQVLDLLLRCSRAGKTAECGVRGGRR